MADLKRVVTGVAGSAVFGNIMPSFSRFSTIEIRSDIVRFRIVGGVGGRGCRLERTAINGRFANHSGLRLEENSVVAITSRL